MEIKYYIFKGEEKIEVNRKTYDEWDGTKCVKSGFVTEYSDGTVIDSSRLFLPLRY